MSLDGTNDRCYLIGEAETIKPIITPAAKRVITEPARTLGRDRRIHRLNVAHFVKSRHYDSPLDRPRHVSFAVWCRLRLWAPARNDVTVRRRRGCSDLLWRLRDGLDAGRRSVVLELERLALASTPHSREAGPGQTRPSGAHGTGSVAPPGAGTEDRRYPPGRGAPLQTLTPAPTIPHHRAGVLVASGEREWKSDRKHSRFGSSSPMAGSLTSNRSNRASRCGSSPLTASGCCNPAGSVAYPEARLRGMSIFSSVSSTTVNGSRCGRRAGVSTAGRFASGSSPRIGRQPPVA